MPVSFLSTYRESSKDGKRNELEEFKITEAYNANGPTNYVGANKNLRMVNWILK